MLRSDLPESQFAADLHGVAGGSPTVPPVYRDARTFFAYTYPTRGLQELVREAFGRFAGRFGASATLRLETSFGGGKTHNLIALWHIAREPGAAAAASGWLDPALLPPEPVGAVALAGDRYGSDEVAVHGSILTRTLWGEMAAQLNRYEVFREADQERLAPGQAGLERLLEGRKVLVLLDELPRYLRAAKGKRVGEGSLADQTLLFFHLLLGYASSHDNLVVVYTLGEREDAYGRERDEIVEQIAEARSLSARQERVVTPIAEGEIAAVLRRRLFQSVDPAAAREVAERYVEHLRRIRTQGDPLPPEVEDPSYAQRLVEAYPFHPELLETLYRKTSSFPTFQWARGALRLLAATVSGLWRDRPADAYLIQSTDIDLSNSAVRQELTSRIERPRLASAIAEDIWSEHGNAHAQQFDRDWAAKGYPHLCQRVAQAVFLHSLVHHAAQGVAGAEPAEAYLACARPNLSSDAIQKALAQIEQHFWYAEFDGRRYVFRDEPTIKKLIADAAMSVGLIAAKQVARAKAQEIFSGGAFEPVAFPTGPETVPDRGNGKPALVLLDFDHVAIEPGQTAVPAVVDEIFHRKGEARDFRNYGNHLVVLGGDAQKREAMIEAGRRVEGIRRLLASEEQQHRLSPEAQKQLQRESDRAQLDFRVAVTNTYSHLFFRSLQDGHIEHYELPAQDSAAAKRQQQSVIRQALAEQGKAFGVRIKSLHPDWILERLWPEGTAELSLADLREAFAKKPRAYLLFEEDLSILRQAVRQGVQDGRWVYADTKNGRVWRRESPPTAEEVRFDHEAVLLTPERAAERYPVAPPVPSPAPTDREERKTEREPQPPFEFESSLGWTAECEGPAPKAFAELADRLTEAGRKALTELELAVGGIENTKQLLAGWSAVANALEDAEVRVEHELALEGADGETITLNFRGPARRFARLQRTLTALLGEAKPEDFAVTRVHAVFHEPVPPSDRRFAELAEYLEETYRCGPVEVKGR